MFIVIQAFIHPLQVENPYFLIGFLQTAGGFSAVNDLSAIDGISFRSSSFILTILLA